MAGLLVTPRKYNRLLWNPCMAVTQRAKALFIYFTESSRFRLHREEISSGKRTTNAHVLFASGCTKGARMEQGHWGCPSLQPKRACLFNRGQQLLIEHGERGVRRKVKAIETSVSPGKKVQTHLAE